MTPRPGQPDNGHLATSPFGGDVDQSPVEYPPTSTSSGLVEPWMNGLEVEPDFVPLDEDDLPPEEVHLVLKIPIPALAAPTNTVPPATISHRIKWSCLILFVFLYTLESSSQTGNSNRDGHTSELRCALPLQILDKSFQDEVRLATSGARNLLFGPSGVLVPEPDSQATAELPSYQDHVMDRVAHPALVAAAGYRPNPWAAHHPLVADQTPLQTPAPSRPSSPIGGISAHPSMPRRESSSSDEPIRNSSFASIQSHFGSDSDPSTTSQIVLSPNRGFDAGRSDISKFKRERKWSIPSAFS